MDYRLKTLYEDFQVTEVPLMPVLAAKRPYSYTYIWLEKSGLTTFAALGKIKDFFRLAYSDIRNQGLKDEDAVTEQLLSVKKVLTNTDAANFNKTFWKRKAKLRIKTIVGYGNEPVKERMLHGNAFRIVVRNIDARAALALVQYVSLSRHHYFINYYDDQRFGLPGGPYNTHLIGQALAEGNWQEAYQQVRLSGNILPGKEKITGISDTKNFFRSFNPKKMAFFVASYNSFLWNKQASSLVQEQTRSKKFLFPNVGRLSLPSSREFICPQLCDISGYEFSEKSFSVKRAPYVRNLVVATTLYAHDIADDELHKKRKKVTLSFFLPTGSYATMIVRQLFLRLKKS